MTAAPTIDQNTDQAVEILRNLVGFDTTSHKSNIPCIEWIEAYLSDLGISSIRIPTEDGLKSSLYATIGPEGVSGIGLSGHTDVVPVTGQDWDTDPFELTQKDGRLFGRGSCDMKGFLACVLAKAPAFKTANLKKPLHLLFSYDEEISCVGVRPMIDEFGKSLTKPEHTIVGEPTSMQVVDAHKGIASFHAEIFGKEAHSSLVHRGVNAINVAAKLIGELERIQADIISAEHNERFEPPYSTVHVGVIQGGEAQNIIPRHTRFVFEIRNLPGSDPYVHIERLKKFAREECLPAMHAVDPKTDIQIVESNSIPSFNTSDGTHIIPMTLGLAQQNDIKAVAYGTEAGLFELGGAVSVICGPGSIAQAHAPNEYIEIKQLTKCLDFLDRLIDQCESTT